MQKWRTSITRMAIAVAVAVAAVAFTAAAATAVAAQPAPTTVTAVVAPSLTPVSGTILGCRSGWVCLYTDHTNVISASHPHTDYFNYGFDNFSNVTGTHWIANNQTGGAPVYLCLNYGGTNCAPFTDVFGQTHPYLPAGFGALVNMTPINSIRLCAAVAGCKR
ncbi:MAG TPA: hypothetical protein VEO01_33585 [Pseudonocardiaceae bacterium]|nr:hypothetical protein [Pseudonocardiaceae bacterium]